MMVAAASGQNNVRAAHPLRKILGLGFGLAFAFGSMVGVGILRLPGMVAAAAGSPTLIVFCWCIGGLYALMGAVSVSELATMYPEAGGFRVYARQAFGDRAGFVIGWIDWLASVATLAYAAVTAVAFVGTLWPGITQYGAAAAIAVLGAFTAMHSFGLRIGSTVTSVASATIGILLLLLILRCFLVLPVTPPAGFAARAVTARHVLSVEALLALVPAIRAILTAYDGWYAPIYTAEECVDASRTIPRSIIGGAFLVGALYVTLNVALLRVLPVPVLAASSLPVAAASQVVLPHGSALLITGLSILIVLGLINGNVISGPRILLSMAREGWISHKAASVSLGGTPRVALMMTTLTSSAMILTGTFNQLIALFAVLILLCYISAFLAVFVLRHRLPDAPRPYRAFGYPVATFVVLCGSVVFLIIAVMKDWRSGVMALLFLILCVPAYALAWRSRLARVGESACNRAGEPIASSGKPR